MWLDHSAQRGDFWLGLHIIACKWGGKFKVIIFTEL